MAAAVLAFAYEVLFLARKPFLRRLATYAPLAVPFAAHLYIRPTMQGVDGRRERGDVEGSLGACAGPQEVEDHTAAAGPAGPVGGALRGCGWI